MNKYALIGTLGEVNCTIITSETLEELQAYRSELIYECPEEVQPGDYTKDEGVTFQSPSPSPGDTYVFDYEDLTWKLDEDLAWMQIRIQRNQLLKACDYTQLPDMQFEMSEIEKEAWRLYRKALRDITDQEDPSNIIWPTKPTT